MTCYWMPSIPVKVGDKLKFTESTIPAGINAVNHILFLCVNLTISIHYTAIKVKMKLINLLPKEFIYLDDLTVEYDPLRRMYLGDSSRAKKILVLPPCPRQVKWTFNVRELHVGESVLIVNKLIPDDFIVAHDTCYVVSPEIAGNLKHRQFFCEDIIVYDKASHEKIGCIALR